MLVLGRRIGQKILLTGEGLDVEVTLMSILDSTVLIKVEDRIGTKLDKGLPVFMELTMTEEATLFAVPKSEVKMRLAEKSSQYFVRLLIAAPLEVNIVRKEVLARMIRELEALQAAEGPK